MCARMLNAFRLLADLSHVLAILLLLLKIIRTKSVAGMREKSVREQGHINMGGREVRVA